jgi:hypothetical protein
MASQQGRQQLLALLLLLGQACISTSAAASTSKEDSILVSYDPQNRQQVCDRIQQCARSAGGHSELQLAQPHQLRLEIVRLASDLQVCMHYKLCSTQQQA